MYVYVCRYFLQGRLVIIYLSRAKITIIEIFMRIVAIVVAVDSFNYRNPRLQSIQKALAIY